MDLISVSEFFTLIAPEITEDTFNLHFCTQETQSRQSDSMQIKKNQTKRNNKKELPQLS